MHTTTHPKLHPYRKLFSRHQASKIRRVVGKLERYNE